MIDSLLHDRLESTLRNTHTYYNLSTPELIELTLIRNETILTDTGALRATTGKFTGRSPKDKFFVVDEQSESRVHWGSVNQKINESVFLRLYDKALDYISKNSAFVFDGFAGASLDAQLPIRIVSEYAWHSLFSRQLFIRPNQEELAMHRPAFTVIDLPSVKADPTSDHTNSETFIIVSFKHRTVLIGGSEYAGEIKKSIFTVLNFLLPQKGILPMHCSANKAPDSDHVALFFGLSGTGKTTLSADPHRQLIGDDEHGWSEHGVFNFEGGCYAKCIGLSASAEPQIWDAIRFGTVLENVVVNEQTRIADYASAEFTENTRAAYPLEFIPNALIPSVAGQPSVIVFLTADASGVLPPISRLTKEQAMYHFLSGYTSKLAGTERGITEPEATFSSCFGAPFLPLHPMEYANMLGQKIDEHRTSVFLVNTGWTGGSCGVGKRMKLEFTRKMVQAAIAGELDHVECITEPYFGLAIPTEITGVPNEVLQPALTWKNQDEYHTAAQSLANRFKKNFTKFHDVPSTIVAAGPRA